ncbi:MAG TPA: acetylxylan esterase [Acidobacteriaceae bacterium]|nr:acetylxylan esterase [Acidobacteriaceae bacterium]
MQLKIASVLCLFAISVGIQSQAPPPTPKPAPTVVAGIPVNYDEAKVGTYTLPDPLKLNNGKAVRDAKTWTTKRRPEIVKLFETQQYGIAPGRPVGESFEVIEKGTPALGGKAIRKQITIHLSKDPAAPEIHLLVYLPAAASKPVPMFFSINFGAIQNAVDDPGITPQKVWNPKTNTPIVPPAGRGFGRLNVEPFLDAGFGVATFYYGDVEPDYLNAAPNGIRARSMKPGQTEREPDAWGAIAAWAWGMSRVEDYFETDKSIDAKRVAIHGVSRLGKTVMWAGAHDERFAAVIASCSGEGGAALSRRDYGETIAHLTAPSRYPYQFAANYAKYGGFPDTAPMDANMLVALIAPRPLLLQTGNTDYWSDPKGEFLAEVAAGPVYKLLGKQDLGTDVWPAAKQPILHDLSYYMHDGGHGMVPTDWDIYLQFLKMHLHPER